MEELALRRGRASAHEVCTGRVSAAVVVAELSDVIDVGRLVMMRHNSRVFSRLLGRTITSGARNAKALYVLG